MAHLSRDVFYSRFKFLKKLKDFNHFSDVIPLDGLNVVRHLLQGMCGAKLNIIYRTHNFIHFQLMCVYSLIYYITICYLTCMATCLFTLYTLYSLSFMRIASMDLYCLLMVTLARDGCCLQNAVTYSIYRHIHMSPLSFLCLF